jgi:hypothetical protein
MGKEATGLMSEMQRHSWPIPFFCFEYIGAGHLNRGNEISFTSRVSPRRAYRPSPSSENIFTWRRFRMAFALAKSAAVKIPHNCAAESARQVKKGRQYGRYGEMSQRQFRGLLRVL